MGPALAYKPGWSFRWEDHNEGRFIRITVSQPDSKGWDRDTMLERTVDFMFLVPEPFDPEWLRNRIAGIEDHETREWFRVDGVLVFDPHADPVFVYPLDFCGDGSRPEQCDSSSSGGRCDVCGVEKDRAEGVGGE